MRSFINIIEGIIGNDDIKPVIDPVKLATAEAQGFDTARMWYHGTRSKAKFNSFKLPAKSKNGEELGRGVYLTKYPGTANVWAQGSGTILACVVRKGEILEMSKVNQTSIFSSAPDADDRWADPFWREMYHGFTLMMKGMESSPGADDAHGGYRDFIDRIQKKQITYADCLKRVGYIGIMSRNSQIRGQAVIWNPDDVMIVGRAKGFEGWSPDEDDDEDRERKGY